MNTDRRKILLVCYYFPPLGGAGIGRPLSLFKYLPDSGFECDILTVKPVAYRVFEPELLKRLDVSRIHRSGSHDPQRLMYLAGFRAVKDAGIRRTRGMSRRFFPDPKVGWVSPAVRLGRKLIERNKYDAIISTSPPISSHLVGQKLSAECKLPWVADFRDFWTSRRIEDEFKSHRMVDKAWSLIRSIKNHPIPVSIIACSQVISEYLGGDEVIYNSYDGNRARLWRTPQDTKHFTIGLLGTFDEVITVEPLLKVIATLRDRQPTLFEKLRLLQVGRLDSKMFRRQLETYRLIEQCDMRGFQGRKETIAILSAASAFYIGLASSKERGIIPGRLFDMMASGRPILAAVPNDSEIEKLLLPSGNCHCFNSDNVASIENSADYLGRLIESQQGGRLKITPLPKYTRQYSARRMSEKFAQVLERLLQT